MFPSSAQETYFSHSKIVFLINLLLKHCAPFFSLVKNINQNFFQNKKKKNYFIVLQNRTSKILEEPTKKYGIKILVIINTIKYIVAITNLLKF